MDKIYNKRILKKLLLIRIIEEEISARYKKQLMRCPIHLSIGQESCAVGVCENLKLTDIIFSNHRSHAHYIAKGCSIEKMIDEIHGKENGCIGGRGGSMHLQDIKKGFFGGFPIVGSSIGLATGTAFSSKRKNLKRVTCVFFGDGAMEEGIIHESLNFASLFKLPIIYICENNFFSIFTHIKNRQPSSNFTRFAKAHNIKSLRINGNKLDNVLISFKKIIKYVRQNSKPFFLQLDTYRYLEHCGPNSDDYHNYRKKSELNFWLNLDPIKYYENKLKKKKIISDIEIGKIKKNIKEKVKLIFNKSEKATFPRSNLAKKNVFKK